MRIFDKKKPQAKQQEAGEHGATATTARPASSTRDLHELRIVTPRATASPSTPTLDSPKVSRRVFEEAQSQHATTTDALVEAINARTHLQAQLAALHANHAVQLLGLEREHSEALKACAKGIRQEAETENAAQLGELLLTQQGELQALRGGHAEALTALQKQHTQTLQDKDEQLTTYKTEHQLTQSLRQRDGELFHYALQRPNIHGIRERGAIPRAALEGHPTSLLARQYAGDFSYAQDDKGAAIVHSSPENWQHILDYLLFDSVPKSAPPSLLSEARHWMLDDFVERLNPTAAAPVAPTNTGVASNAIGGFTLSIALYDFPPPEGASTDLVEVKACGLDLRVYATREKLHWYIAGDQRLEVTMHLTSHVLDEWISWFTLSKTEHCVTWKQPECKNIYRLIGADNAMRAQLTFTFVD